MIHLTITKKHYELVGCQVNQTHWQVFSCVWMYELFVVPEKYIYNWVTNAKTSISTDLDVHTDKLGV